MKKLVTIFIILLMINIPLYPSAEESTERVLILFNGSVDEQLLQHESIEIHHVYESISAASVTIPTSSIDVLQNKPNVLKVEPDPIVKTMQQVNSWGYEKVQAPTANSNGWTGKGVKVGIIDTGVRSNHPDLKIAGGISFVNGTSTFEDDEGHGTHVAGIIGALNNDIGTIGIAPEAEIYAIKSLNKSGIGILSDVIAGVDWAIQNNLDIINLSLTSDQGSSFLKAVLDKAYNNGMLIIAASGNSQTTLPSNTDVLYPARYDSVIAVGSVDRNYNKSKFSYFGPSLEFVAPGERIYSTFSQPDYEYQYGTSMAAPFVTGVLALYKQAYPELTNKELRQLVQASALDLGEMGKDTSYGYGLVQAPTEKRVFFDVPSDEWYAEEISFLFDRGIVTGYEGKNFAPEKPVTRAEAITMIGRAKGYDGVERPTRYTDVPSNFYASGYIERASEELIIDGYPNGSFKPGAPIIRGDVATMLKRAYGYQSTVTTGFTDVGNTYYTEPIYALFSNRITEGYPDKTFKPTKNITRAEFAVFLARALDDSFK